MQQRRKDLMIAPVCEAGLILLTALAGWLAHKPLIFASLGPTAYEMIETPHRPSARPYNIVAGHFIAVVCAFAMLRVTGAWYTPAVSSGTLAPARMWAIVLAAMLTVFLTLLARAAQPAAIATSLLITVGSMQQPRDAFNIMAGVALMTLAGEPLRLWRLRNEQSS